MTVASTTSKVSYSGSGSVGPYPIPFRFIKDADIVAVQATAAGVETTLALGTNYTLTGAGDTSGGALTLDQALPVGSTLVISRNPAVVQETDYVENAAFPAETHEAALDLLTMICQALDEKISRAVLVDISSTTDPSDLLDEIDADVASAAASAATATTQAGLASAARVGAETAQGLAEDARDLAQEWAVNPEDDPITGYPGEFSALHWAAKAAAAASGGALKVSADDTTAGYLDGKLALVANSGLTTATTNPGGNEVFTFGIDLAPSPGLLLSSAGLHVDYTAVQAFDPELAAIASATFSEGDILYHNGTNLARLAAGTSGHYLKTLGAGGNPLWAEVSAGGGMWEYISKATATDDATVDFTGLDTDSYEYRVIATDIDPATDATDLWLRMGYGAGPTWFDANNYVYGGLLIPYAGTHVEFCSTGQNTLAAAMLSRNFDSTNLQNRVAVELGAGASRYVSGFAACSNDAASSVCNFQLRANPSEAWTGIRFLMSAGNVNAGTFELYRRTKN